MDECKVCGRQNPIEGANFCYYCGASLREGKVELPEKPSEEPAKADAEFAMGSPVKPFSTARWFGLLLLLLIPPYGWIAFLVIALISAFGANATEERRSFAKACLLFMLVVVLVAIWANAFLRSHPELLAEYNKLFEQIQTAR